jgi:hypothetical protein
VSQLPPSQDHSVEQFLDMWISGFGLGQDFTDEIDWSLDQECMPLLLSLNDDGRADHLVGRRNV